MDIGCCQSSQGATPGHRHDFAKKNASIGLLMSSYGAKGDYMSSETIFRIQLVLGYVAWLLCFGAYFWPRLKTMDQVNAQRLIATLHSFRFFGLVFILPGIVGPSLPAGFTTFAAYGD